MVRITYCKALCYCVTICRKDRQLKLKNAAVDRFDQALDVQNILETYTNVNLFLHYVLSGTQKLLFLNHQGRKISTNKDYESDQFLKFNEYAKDL